MVSSFFHPPLIHKRASSANGTISIITSAASTSRSIAGNHAYILISQRRRLRRNLRADDQCCSLRYVDHIATYDGSVTVYAGLIEPGCSAGNARWVFTL